MSFKQSRYFVCKLNFDYAGKNWKTLSVKDNDLKTILVSLIITAFGTLDSEATFCKVNGNLLLLQNRQYLSVSVMRQVARQIVSVIPSLMNESYFHYS